MIMNVFLIITMVLPVLILGQDTTIFPGDSTNTDSGVFPISWPDVFDLVDLVLAWSLGIIIGAPRKILEFLSAIIPYLRVFVDKLQKKEIIDLSFKRQAYAESTGKKPDIEIKYLLPILFLCLFSSELFAQIPIEFPSAPIPGLKLYAFNDQGVEVEVNHQDTLHFTIRDRGVTGIETDSVITLDWLKFPMFLPEFGADYLLVGSYDYGQVLKTERRGDTISTSGGRWPDKLRGEYYAVVKDGAKGRFIRFYIQTNEGEVGDVINVFDTTQVFQTVMVYDTTKAFIVDSADIGVLQAGLEWIIKDLDNLSFTNISIKLDSILLAVDRLKVTPEPVQILSRQQVIIQELQSLTVEQLVEKYYKSQTILVSGYDLTTYDFADWAGVVRSATESIIFTQAKALIQ